MADDNQEDLSPERTAGFKVGEKKTLDEYAKLDQEDEALNRWKASLGLGSGQPVGDPNDPRTCVIKKLSLEIEDGPEITIDLAKSKTEPYDIKEGTNFQMKAVFVVQHEVLSGLKYVQVVKRKGFSRKRDEMIGSYPPNTTDKPTYEKKFDPEKVPSGFVWRGHYDAVGKFIDDDDVTHLKFEWSFNITKE